MNRLGKRIPGTPLSEPEHQQRRAAAHARWAALAAGGLVGAHAGALAAGLRHGIWTQNRAGAQVQAGIIEGDLAREQARQQVLADAARRAERINASVAHRLRGSRESQAERQQRLREALAGRRTTRPADRPPVIGTRENAEIYDYELAELQRQRQRRQTFVDTLKAREAAGEDVPGRDMRARVKAVADIQRDIDHMQRLKDAAAQRRARRGTTRQQGGREVEVRATTERKYVGGETIKQKQKRITDAKRVLRARHGALLEHLDRRTAQIREARADAAAAEARRLVQEAYAGNLYGRRWGKAVGRGALIGASIGLTSAGLAVIAHHVAKTLARKDTLEKATEEDPEHSIGRGMAETFRQWIDRLLGRTAQPMSLGDNLAAALAPGITQAFAQGAAQRPLPTAPGAPSYHVDVDFDLMNPSVRRHMADYALDRIVDITHQQREAIRDVLMQQSVLQGMGPRDVARAVREHIGLTPHQQAVVQGYRRELEGLDPAALERELRDKRYDRTVRAAIQAGKPLSAEQIDAMVDAYHRRMLALRAETIARTEAIRATSYGSVARAQDVLDQHPGQLEVVKRWIATDDHRTRPTHRDLNGKEVIGMETPFKSSAGALIRWPIDTAAPADECINCRCALAYRFVPRNSIDRPIRMAEAV